MNKKLISIVVIVFIGVGVYFTLNNQRLSLPQTITNFEECVQAGYPVGESYPRQCWASNGGHFVEEIKIEFIKEKYISELMVIDGVVGMGIGECENNPCIKVFLENDSADLRKQIPVTLEGFKVDIEITGPIEVLPHINSITIFGEITCLPKIGTGPQTLECAIGLKGNDGKYYGLKNLFERTEYKFSQAGLRVKVSGILSIENMLGPDGNKYDIVGVIDIVSIKKINNKNIQP